MKNTLILLAISLTVISFCSDSDNQLSVLPYQTQTETKLSLAKGTVFYDLNKNQQFDENEKGIPGVSVSNGIDIVQTNEKGKYEIPVTDDAIIFVIKPKDWMTPLNENNLPLFYYIHKPQGSPENFTYQGSEPTGKLPEEINFPLIPESTSKEFKIVVFGDPQAYSIEQVDYVAEDIATELIGRNDLQFGMTMGDIVGDNLDLFSPINQVVATIEIPWYNVMGNHDINYMAPNDELSDDTFESVYGPATYAFVYGHVHFIVLDDVIHFDEAGSKKYVGGLRPDQLQFVENYLNSIAKDELVVLTMHIPLAQHGKTFRNSDQKRLFELLKDFPNTLSISAHTHMLDNYFFHEASSDWQQEVPHHHFNVGTTSGSWWNGMKSETDIPHTMMRDGTPNGYSIITFKGTDYIIDWKVAGKPAENRMNIHVPRGIVANSLDTTLLTVNFFNGSEQSKLEYRIKGQTDWKPMVKINKHDPYFQMITQRWINFEKLNIAEIWEADSTLVDEKFPGTKMPYPEKANHIWEANIGTDYPAGRYIIEVKATDRYGRVFTDYHTMRVAVQK